MYTRGMLVNNVSSEYQHLQPFTTISSIFTSKKKWGIRLDNVGKQMFWPSLHFQPIQDIGRA